MWTLLAVILGLVCLPGIVELALLTTGSLMFSRKHHKDRHDTEEAGFRLAVIVPAHNEESAIGSTALDLVQKAGSDAAVFVIADNCQDATAEVARAAGANVLIRVCQEEPGKSAALRFAFRTLEAAGFDGFLVLDSDSRISERLIVDVRDALAAGADVVQCRNVVGNPAASNRMALLALALAGFNGVRPRGRERLGLSAGPLANGFAVTLGTLRRVPFTTTSIVEDLEYHLLLVEAGLQVRFLDSAMIRSDMPAHGPNTASQRARWEGGRLGVTRAWVPRLMARRQVRTLEPLLELLTFPLVYQALLVAMWVLLAPAGWLQFAACGSAFILAAHIAAAALCLEKPLDGLRAMAFAPVYAVWKLALLSRTLRAAKPGAAWAEKSAS